MLLHGFMQDGTLWEDSAEALAVTNYVVAPTMTPPSPDESSLGDMAEGVYGVIQQCALHTRRFKAIVVGYSFGGRVALEFARRYPEVLSGLVLESASLGPRTESERASLKERNELWADQFEQAESMKEVVDIWEKVPLFATQRSLDEKVRESIRKVRLRGDKEQLAWLLRSAGAHTMPLEDEACALLKELPVPVLYAAGSSDAKYSEVADRVEALGAAHIQVARFACGHNIHLESPVAYAERLRAFANSVE